MPIFVLTHRPPKRHPKENDRLTFTFVTDGIESAIQQAKAAAGAKDVTVIGATNTAQQCLRAGLRLFEDASMDQIQLERLQVVELPAGRTHLEFRILK